MFSPLRQIQSADHYCRSPDTQNVSRVTLFSPLQQLQPADHIPNPLLLPSLRTIWLWSLERCKGAENIVEPDEIQQTERLLVNNRFRDSRDSAEVRAAQPGLLLVLVVLLLVEPAMPAA